MGLHGALVLGAPGGLLGRVHPGGPPLHQTVGPAPGKEGLGGPLQTQRGEDREDGVRPDEKKKQSNEINHQK